MALKALTSESKYEFESELDPDKGTEKATKFIIGAVPARIILASEMAVGAMEDMSLLDANVNSIMSLLENGLKGWRNFIDEDGKEIQFVKTPEGLASPQSIDLINHTVKLELMGAIMRYNKLGDLAKK